MEDKPRLKTELITYEQLANAFIDVLDGWSFWGDIQKQTGLSDARCKDISRIFSELYDKNFGS